MTNLNPCLKLFNIFARKWGNERTEKIGAFAFTIKMSGKKYKSSYRSAKMLNSVINEMTDKKILLGFIGAQQVHCS